MLRLVLAVVLFLMAAPLWAQNDYQEDFGGHTVHFSVFNSTVLKPEVAAALGVERGNDRFLVNIAVIDNEQPNAGGQPADVSGTATNLLQQKKSLEFFSVEEQGVEYYLAPLRSSDRDVWRFEIDVNPQGDGGPYMLKFQKKLYVD